jgi:hypothetical protein
MAQNNVLVCYVEGNLAIRVSRNKASRQFISRNFVIRRHSNKVSVGFMRKKLRDS